MQQNTSDTGPAPVPTDRRMNKPRAWSLLSVEHTELQYAGNIGYSDDPERIYRYDSEVANYKQLSIGDLILVRSKIRLLGIAKIESIDRNEQGEKLRKRCPKCNSTKIKVRIKQPHWRCHGCKSEFDAPSEENVGVTSYEAIYGNTFISILEKVPVEEIKAAVIRPSDQMSIAEIDISKLEIKLIAAHPSVATLLSSFAMGLSLDPHEAESRNPNVTQQTSLIGYFGSLIDTRKKVLRSIVARRGQRQFRDKLIRRYGGRCVFSGCNLISVLEAAHIDAYRDESHNHPENGLLLRADLHTLFDLGLIVINPDEFKIHMHPEVAKVADYAMLHGSRLKIFGNSFPSTEALQRRWETFNGAFL